MSSAFFPSVHPNKVHMHTAAKAIAHCLIFFSPLHSNFAKCFRDSFQYVLRRHSIPSDASCANISRSSVQVCGRGHGRIAGHALRYKGSSLPYEVSVMRNYALPILQGVSEENERHDELLELIGAFQYFQPIDPALVPRDSLLREFIGGGSYKYH